LASQDASTQQSTPTRLGLAGCLHTTIYDCSVLAILNLHTVWKRVGCPAEIDIVGEIATQLQIYTILCTKTYSNNMGTTDNRKKRPPATNLQNHRQNKHNRQREQSQEDQSSDIDRDVSLIVNKCIEFGVFRVFLKLIQSICGRNGR
jgi:hypothetical protein